MKYEAFVTDRMHRRVTKYLFGHYGLSSSQVVRNALSLLLLAANEIRNGKEIGVFSKKEDGTTELDYIIHLPEDK